MNIFLQGQKGTRAKVPCALCILFDDSAKGKLRIRCHGIGLVEYHKFHATAKKLDTRGGKSDRGWHDL